MSDDILHTGRADIHHPKGPLTASPEPIIQEWEIEELGPHLPSQAKFKRKVAIFTEDGLAARDARVRAAALRDFAASMRAFAEQAPEGEPAGWPWTAYALAAVKAEEHAGKGFPRVQDGSTDTTGTPEHPSPLDYCCAPPGCGHHIDGHSRGSHCTHPGCGCRVWRDHVNCDHRAGSVPSLPEETPS